MTDQREDHVEGDIRVALWNTCRWQGAPQEVAQSFIRHAMEEPTMVRALAILSANASMWREAATAPKDGTYIDLWFGGEDGERETNAYWGRPQHTCGEAGRYCDCCPSYDAWVDSTFNHYLTGEEGLQSEEPAFWCPITPPAAVRIMGEGEGS